MQGPLDTFKELAILGADFSIMVGGGLHLRSKMKPGTGGTVAVAVCAVIAMAIGWIMLHDLHQGAELHRPAKAIPEKAIRSARREECDRPAPLAANLAAMHELMCARDARYAELRAAGDVDVGVVAHGDLIGTALPSAPVGKTYVVALVAPGDDVVAMYPVDPTAPFSYLRDGHVPGVQKVRLFIDDKVVADAVLAP